MQNPYGAVPQALADTRLSLSEIMKDYMAMKVLENKNDVDRAKLEIQKEGIQLEGEKAKAQGLADLARTRYETRTGEKRLANEAASLSEAARHNEAMEGVAGRNAAANERRVSLEERQRQYLKASVPSDRLADELGLMPSQKALFMEMFPKSATREMAMQAANRLSENPALMYQFGILGSIDKLEQLGEQLQDDTLQPEERRNLGGRFDRVMRKVGLQKSILDFMREGKTRITPKEFKEYEAELDYAWDEMSPEQQARFEDKKAFKKAAWDDFRAVVKQGHLGLKELEKLKTPPPKKDPDAAIQRIVKIPPDHPRRQEAIDAFLEEYPDQGDKLRKALITGKPTPPPDKKTKKAPGWSAGLFESPAL